MQTKLQQATHTTNVCKPNYIHTEFKIGERDFYENRYATAAGHLRM